MSDEHLYLKASQELTEDRADAALWVKAMTVCTGDPNAATSYYVKTRVGQMKSEAAREAARRHFEAAKKAARAVGWWILRGAAVIAGLLIVRCMQSQGGNTLSESSPAPAPMIYTPAVHSSTPSPYSISLPTPALVESFPVPPVYRAEPIADPVPPPLIPQHPWKPGSEQGIAYFHALQRSGLSREEALEAWKNWFPKGAREHLSPKAVPMIQEERKAYERIAAGEPD